MILLVCVGLAPFVPGLIASRLETLNSPETSRAEWEGEVDDGDRIYRITSDSRGHFVAEVRVNGHYVDMMVDTGATLTALPQSLAEDIGIYLDKSDFRHSIRTANGIVLGAKTTIDRLSIGDIRFSEVDAFVLEDERMGDPLLGMSVLNRLRKFDMSDGTLVLIQ
ncbi:TIGR02281 family clan AA aspartic protease [Labrenzia sp. 011]|uniref:retropepsin-like aspartic protease family protein n=1 Tax=Labrenzia sp. 011 TaxID=2171494 RepID=UPI001401E66C|nr:TIGR02281 family clan AA aspartic protease [Labrenzia sp. 011]